MEAEKFCVSLETAKRLHEAGIKVDSYYHWVSSIYVSEEDSIKYPDLVHTESDIGQYYCADHKGQPAFVLLQTSDSNCHSIINLDYEPVRFDYLAPTAEELRKYLPLSIKTKVGIEYNISVDLNEMTICYILDNLDFVEDYPYFLTEEIHADTLQELFAEMLIRLKKEAGYELTSDKG